MLCAKVAWHTHNFFLEMPKKEPRERGYFYHISKITMTPQRFQLYNARTQYHWDSIIFLSFFHFINALDGRLTILNYFTFSSPLHLLSWISRLNAETMKIEPITMPSSQRLNVRREIHMHFDWFSNTDFDPAQLSCREKSPGPLDFCHEERARRRHKSYFASAIWMNTEKILYLPS